MVLDFANLENYLERHLADFSGPLTVEKFSNGQSNPTFLLTTPGRRYVLRSKPPGQLLKSAHAVDREFRVQSTLALTDVPVAEVYHLCQDETIIGAMFYVMDYLDGRIFWDPALPGLSRQERGQIYEQMNKTLAAIHCVDLQASGLDDYGKPGDYFARQLSRWTKQYRASQTETLPAMENLIVWLEENLPEEDEQVSLIHGDYRLDNLMFAPDRLEVIGVFDWELSTLGHPIADLSYQIMQRSMGRDWHIKGLAGLNLSDLGIPSESEYIDTYCRHTGQGAIDNWPFYLSFSFFRFAAICQGVKSRAQQGNASSEDAEKVGKMAQPLAELGWQVVMRNQEM